MEIGRGKSGRRAYALDEIGIVPSRRTRHPEEVSIAWQIDAYRFELPLVVAPMDSVVSPATAIEIGRLGGLAVLDLEGLWTRFDDPEPLLAEVAGLDDEAATRRLQEIYSEPIKEDLIGRRIEEIRAAGVTSATSGTRPSTCTRTRSPSRSVAVIRPGHTFRGLPSGSLRWRLTARGSMATYTSPCCSSAVTMAAPDSRPTVCPDAWPRNRFTPTRSAT